MYGPGSVLAGRYRLDERVGGGGMGEVWRATDQTLERTVAVKMMRQEFVEEPGFADRFLIEARTMAAIKHPGVVAIHDYRGGEDAAFLVMEYVEGESLARRLHRFGRLDPIRSMHLIAQAAEALHAAHERGVVHRDIKPGNLLVTTAGTVVLTDFGIARSAASTSLTATGAVVGTPSYLAPEQVLGKPATARTDVYALGVVAYECLAGRRPFDGDNPFEVAMKRLREPPPTLAVEAPAAVLAVVERALAAEPEQRWHTAAEFATAARQAAAPGSGGTTVPEAPAGAGASPGSGGSVAGRSPVPEFSPARVAIPAAETAAPASPPAAPVAPTKLETPQSPLPPPAAPVPVARPPTPPPSPVPPAVPQPWPVPRRPVLVAIASVTLLAGSGALALYFSGTLRAIGTWRDVYESYFAGSGVGSGSDDAAGAVGVVGAVVAGAGLLLSLILMLLTWPAYLGKRAARGWAFALGWSVLSCCSAPIAVDAFGQGLGSFATTPAERAQLDRQVVEAMPGWYELVTGPLPLFGLAGLLAAMFLFSLPPVSAFYRRPRPVPYHPYYYGYPFYYGYPYR